MVGSRLALAERNTQVGLDCGDHVRPGNAGGCADVVKLCPVASLLVSAKAKIPPASTSAQNHQAGGKDFLHSIGMATSQYCTPFGTSIVTFKGSLLDGSGMLPLLVRSDGEQGPE